MAITPGWSALATRALPWKRFASCFANAEPASDAVVRLDPALDALVSPDAKVELVKGGFGFTEGPVWMTEGKSGYLLFTDIPGNVVWKLTPDGKALMAKCDLQIDRFEARIPVLRPGVRYWRIG